MPSGHSDAPMPLEQPRPSYVDKGTSTYDFLRCDAPRSSEQNRGELQDNTANLTIRDQPDAKGNYYASIKKHYGWDHSSWSHVECTYSSWLNPKEGSLTLETNESPSLYHLAGNWERLIEAQISRIREVSSCELTNLTKVTVPIRDQDRSTLMKRIPDLFKKNDKGEYDIKTYTKGDDKDNVATLLETRVGKDVSFLLERFFPGQSVSSIRANKNFIEFTLDPSL